MDQDEQHESAAERSAILRLEFGRSWRAWSWFRRQFTPTSLGAIGFVVVTCGGYIVHLHETVARQDTRIVVLETKIVPFVAGSADIKVLQALEDMNELRIGQLEADYLFARREAGTQPVTRRRK